MATRINSDLKDIVSALSSARVRFLVVGGIAVIEHTEPRYTNGIDLWVEPTLGNARRVLVALKKFGAPLAEEGRPAAGPRGRRATEAADSEGWSEAVSRLARSGRRDKQRARGSVRAGAPIRREEVGVVVARVAHRPLVLRPRAHVVQQSR